MDGLIDWLIDWLIIRTRRPATRRSDSIRVRRSVRWSHAAAAGDPHEDPMTSPCCPDLQSTAWTRPARCLYSSRRLCDPGTVCKRQHFITMLAASTKKSVNLRSDVLIQWPVAAVCASICLCGLFLTLIQLRPISTAPTRSADILAFTSEGQLVNSQVCTWSH